MLNRTTIFNLTIVVLLVLALTPQPLKALNEAEAPDGSTQRISDLSDSVIKNYIVAPRAATGGNGMLANVIGESAVEGANFQASTSDSSGWAIECVDCPKQFRSMTDRSLQLDDKNQPHVAYGEDNLYYAWHDGVAWHYETVDDSPYVGLYASLALDGSDHPHISYYDSDNADLKYAHWDGTNWHIQTVDSEGGQSTSLALDESDYPHISYYDTTNDDLKYAYWDGTNWHIQTVDSEGAVGWNSSLALDGSSYPHISYYDGSSNDLKYACWDGSSWHTEAVDSDGYLGASNSLALDSDDHPHISYYDWSTLGHSYSDLKYAHYDGSLWHIETVKYGGVGGDISLMLDDADYPHISYDGPNNLNYAHYWTLDKCK